MLAAARARRRGGAARAVEAEALAILEEDVEACRLIGEHGRARAARRAARCSRSATPAGWPPAAGAPRSASSTRRPRAGEPVEVLACETRPLLQGARLTAWELAARRHPRDRADRGRRAALLARGGDRRRDRRRRPRRGQRRRREQDRHLRARDRRPPPRRPVLRRRAALDARRGDRRGRRRSRSSSAPAPRCALAAGLPDDVAVWNPAFDVTPAALITAIICDAGVLRPPFEATIADALGTTAPREGRGPARAGRPADRRPCPSRRRGRARSCWTSARRSAAAPT